MKITFLIAFILIIFLGCENTVELSPEENDKIASAIRDHNMSVAGDLLAGFVKKETGKDTVLSVYFDLPQTGEISDVLLATVVVSDLYHKCQGCQHRNENCTNKCVAAPSKFRRKTKCAIPIPIK